MKEKRLIFYVAYPPENSGTNEDSSKPRENRDIPKIDTEKIGDSAAQELLHAKELEILPENIRDAVINYLPGSHTGRIEHNKKILDAITANKAELAKKGIKINYLGATNGSPHSPNGSPEWQEQKSKAFEQLLAFNQTPGHLIPADLLSPAEIDVINAYRTSEDKQSYVTDNEDYFLPRGKLFDKALSLQRAEDMKKYLEGPDAKLDPLVDILEIRLGESLNAENERYAGIFLTSETHPGGPTDPPPKAPAPTPKYKIESTETLSEYLLTLTNEKGKEIHFQLKITSEDVTKISFKRDLEEISERGLRVAKDPDGSEYIRIWLGDQWGRFKFVDGEIEKSLGNYSIQFEYDDEKKKESGTITLKYEKEPKKTYKFDDKTQTLTEKASSGETTIHFNLPEDATMKFSERVAEGSDEASYTVEITIGKETITLSNFYNDENGWQYYEDSSDDFKRNYQFTQDSTDFTLQDTPEDEKVAKLILKGKNLTVEFPDGTIQRYTISMPRGVNIDQEVGRVTGGTYEALYLNKDPSINISFDSDGSIDKSEDFEGAYTAAIEEPKKGKTKILKITRKKQTKEIDGDKYEGEFDGDIFLRGKKTLKDGTILEGEFYQDKDGNLRKGKIISKDGTITAEGDFYRNGNIRKGKRISSPSGNILEGDFYDNNYLKKGKLTKPDGAVLEGTWKKDGNPLNVKQISAPTSEPPPTPPPEPEKEQPKAPEASYEIEKDKTSGRLFLTIKEGGTIYHLHWIDILPANTEIQSYRAYIEEDGTYTGIKNQPVIQISLQGQTVIIWFDEKGAIKHNGSEGFDEKFEVNLNGTIIEIHSKIKAEQEPEKTPTKKTLPDGSTEEGTFDPNTKRLIKGKRIKFNGKILLGTFDKDTGFLVLGKVTYTDGRVMNGTFDKNTGYLVSGESKHRDKSVLKGTFDKTTGNPLAGSTWTYPNGSIYIFDGTRWNPKPQAERAPEPAPTPTPAPTPAPEPKKEPQKTPPTPTPQPTENKVAPAPAPYKSLSLNGKTLTFKDKQGYERPYTISVPQGLTLKSSKNNLGEELILVYQGEKAVLTIYRDPKVDDIAYKSEPNPEAENLYALNYNWQPKPAEIEIVPTPNVWLEDVSTWSLSHKLIKFFNPETKSVDEYKIKVDSDLEDKITYKLNISAYGTGTDVDILYDNQRVGLIYVHKGVISGYDGLGEQFKVSKVEDVFTISHEPKTPEQILKEVSDGARWTPTGKNPNREEYKNFTRDKQPDDSYIYYRVDSQGIMKKIKTTAEEYVAIKPKIDQIKAKSGLRIELSSEPYNYENLLTQLENLDVALSHLNDATIASLQPPVIIYASQSLNTITEVRKDYIVFNINVNQDAAHIYIDIIASLNEIKLDKLRLALQQYGVPHVLTWSSKKYEKEFYDNLHKIENAFSKLSDNTKANLRKLNLPVILTPMSDWETGIEIEADEGLTLVRMSDKKNYWHINLDPSEDEEDITAEIEGAVNDYLKKLEEKQND